MGKTTDKLTSILKNTHPENLKDFFKENEKQFKTSEKAFSDYVRKVIANNGLKEHDVFIQADIPDRYGYKLLSLEKHTKQRDIILRICIVSKMSVEQTNEALKLYGMNELYAKNKRDSVVMNCLYHNIYDINRLNELLEENDLEKLRECGNSY